MDHAPWGENDLASVVFVGQTLAPFFLQDPQKGTAGELFDAVTALDVDAAAREWPFVEDAAAHECLAGMRQALAAGVTDELIWEYRRLFVGPGPKAAPPWGSVYTDREQVMFGLTTLDLRQWMREQGIERKQDDRNPEDHIGLLLELMAWLADNRPWALDDYLRLHLLTWAPHFLEVMERATAHDFYRSLARLTRLSLEGVRDARGLSVVEPRFYR